MPFPAHCKEKVIIMPFWGLFNIPEKLFGFELKKSKTEQKAADAKNLSFTAANTDDGAINIDFSNGLQDALNSYGPAGIQSENEMIMRYRQMSLHHEVDTAIDDIITEMIISDQQKPSVDIILDNVELGSGTKKTIRNEFFGLQKMLNFKSRGYELARRWYIDGRIYFHIVLDPQHLRDGILDIRYVEPLLIRKIRNIVKEPDAQGNQIIKSTEEFFVYNELPQQPWPSSGLQISPDAVCYCPSGLFDSTQKRSIGYLHKAIKPLNQLKMLEDAVVIYHFSRAPDRRIFYVDVGNMPVSRINQYMRDVMNRHRNKLVYDAATGEIKDDKKYTNMLEDYWLPRREGSRGTEIDTLKGDNQIGEINQLSYFQKKLYKALNVPFSRMNTDDNFRLGRSTEISRDEVKFSKFIDRLRTKFSEIWLSLLRVQLISKGILTPDEWEKIKSDIYFDYLHDTYFQELKEMEILKSRLDLAREMKEFAGIFYSEDYIRRVVLRQNDDEIKELDAKMKEEEPKVMERLQKEAEAQLLLQSEVTEESPKEKSKKTK
jgi:hypothetical protein